MINNIIYGHMTSSDVLQKTCALRPAPESSGESVMHPWMQRQTSQNDVHPRGGSPHPASEAGNNLTAEIA